MRRYAAVAAVVVGALSLAIPSFATDYSQSLDITLTKAKKSTKKKPVGTKLTLNINNSTSDGSKPPPANKAEIYLDDFTFNKSSFSYCKQSVIDSLDFSACKKAKVGSGTSTIDARDDINNGNLNATVDVYNGKGQKIYLVIGVTSPTVITQVLTGTFSKQTGDFKKKLTVEIPDQVLPLTGGFAAIDDITVTIGATTKVKKSKKSKKKVTVNFLETPKTCTGVWKFAQTTTYKTGFAPIDSVSNTDEVPCS